MIGSKVSVELIVNIVGIYLFTYFYDTVNSYCYSNNMNHICEWGERRRSIRHSRIQKNRFERKARWGPKESFVTCVNSSKPLQKVIWTHNFLILLTVWPLQVLQAYFLIYFCSILSVFGLSCSWYLIKYCKMTYRVDINTVNSIVGFRKEAIY